MKNIAFIINPVSGTLNKQRLPKLIEKTIDKEQWAVDIVFTEYAGHATLLAEQYAKMGFDVVAAVGGDGTVHEVACGLRDTQTALGLVPIGSGNGLARHLNIPLRVQHALEMLNHSEPISMDYGVVSDGTKSEPFFCTCGIGFDAYVADRFAAEGKRGIRTYVQEVVKNAFTYLPQKYHLVGQDVNMEIEAFLITFANANQWGNAAYIAPKASVQDGLMDIAIMNSFAVAVTPIVALQLFTKTMEEGMYMHTLRVPEITLWREVAGSFHLDGDPNHFGEEINIKMVHDGLRVQVERRF